ncbi:MAG: helix-turn-helix transcriptional regulator [Propionibacteriales bacterium]|nr:helix-turn-helix transcriptional regulator [Propionibacteriales bacterium]
MATASTSHELGAFLRSRRSALSPVTLGLPSYGQRRVQGLRREELALLAGVSTAYYTRLEQGASLTASESVLDSLASALGLDEDERAHLKTLARPTPNAKPATTRPERATPELRQLVSAMMGTPALLLGRFQDVLDWNPEAHRLFAGHLDVDAPRNRRTRPNMVRMLFLDPEGRALYRDWQQQAAYSVSALRFAAGEFPNDGALRELVGELSTVSQEFAELWAKRTVRRCAGGSKQFRHPEFGDFDLDFESLDVPRQPGQRLLLLSAKPGTADEAALLLLAHASREATVGTT